MWALWWLPCSMASTKPISEAVGDRWTVLVVKILRSVSERG
jgi:hypothetical protein